MRTIFIIACASFTVCSCFSQINKPYYYPLNSDSRITPRPLSIVALALLDNSILPVFEQDKDAGETLIVSKKKHINFFIISKRHKHKLDLATRYNIFKTKLKAFFRPNHFVSIVAKDEEQAGAEIIYHLNKHNARIGTIWFDSHGEYIKGYSLFTIGKDEVNYRSLKDSAINTPLSRVAAYADRETKVVIGSCYGGATYRRSSIDYKDTTRMNGDSLMFEMGKIFTRSTIYACESWVMSGPGLFQERGSVAGYPGRHLFHDVCYKPVWETMGKWNEYNAAKKSFSTVNPVTLDKYGSLKLRVWAYTDHADVNKDINKNIYRLEPGLYR